MSEHEQPSFQLNKAARFSILIGGSVIVAILMVAASLSLYSSTGTEQLDLSRPGYADIRKQATSSESTKTFDASGPINDKVIDQFAKEYDKRLNEATSVDAFGEDVLSPKSLQIDDQSNAQQD